MKNLFLIFAFTISSCFVFADEAMDLGIAKIVRPDGSLGTAFAVANPKDNLYLFATALHVVTDDKDKVMMSPVFKLIFSDVDKEDLSVMANVSTYDKESDIAVLWAYMPKSINTMELTNLYDKIPENTKIYKPMEKKIEATFLGYANGSWYKTNGTVSIKDRNQIYSDSIVIPGQSGGPMVVNGKVAGVISGGSMWLENNDKISITWPTRCGSSTVLFKLIEQAKTSVK